MRRIIVIALLLLCAGCAASGQGRSSWAKSADFLNQDTRTFFTKDTDPWAKSPK